MKKPMILASASPRRQELLTRMGLAYEVCAAEVDEDVQGPACQVVRLLAERKALAVAEKYPDRTVLAADTLVSVDDIALGKPKGAEDAKYMLMRLQGRWHEVWTGVCLVAPGGARRVEQACTRVHFVPLTEEEADAYVSTGEPLGKAGAYAIQGRAGMFVDAIEGSYSNVVGLPLTLVKDLLPFAEATLEKESNQTL